ncbi:unnamed protein product, partial [Rotaria sordida]
MASNNFVIINETSTSSSSSFSSSSLSCSSSCPSLTCSSSAATKLTVNKTTSNKRNPMLTVHGYYFQLKNYNKAKTIRFWRCANRSCAVLLHTNLNDEFVRFSGSMTEHSHPPNPAELEIINLREEMRKRAEHELLPLQEIAEQEAVYRNVQFYGLSSTYLENIMVRSVIRRMMALALVPPEHVPSLFDRLGEELNPEERDQLLDLFKYFN